jgi:hypothetical protein
MAYTQRSARVRIPKLEAQRDEILLGLLELRRKYETPAVTRQETAVALNSD